MNLSYVRGGNLAFDTDVFRANAKEFSSLGDQISESANSLNKILSNLKDTGWTTGAGKAYFDVFETSWKKEMDKYADYMNELSVILCEVSDMYEDLVDDYISKVGP